MWKGYCLNGANTFWRQRALADQKFSIFLWINIIGDYSQVIAGPELFTQPINQSCFTTTDRACNPNPECRHNLVIRHDQTIPSRTKNIAEPAAGPQLVRRSAVHRQHAPHMSQDQPR